MCNIVTTDSEIIANLQTNAFTLNSNMHANIVCIYIKILCHKLNLVILIINT